MKHEYLLESLCSVSVLIFFCATAWLDTQASLFDHVPLAGFLFIKDCQAARHLADFICQNAAEKVYVTQPLVNYKARYPERISHLPIFDPAVYPDAVDLVFASHVNDLDCVFDGTHYGQVITVSQALLHTRSTANVA